MNKNILYITLPALALIAGVTAMWNRDMQSPAPELAAPAVAVTEEKVLPQLP